MLQQRKSFACVATTYAGTPVSAILDDAWEPRALSFAATRQYHKVLRGSIDAPVAASVSLA
jgi:hypothetical protein